VPFKFSRSIKDHSKYITDTKFSFDGQLFASVGLDAKICIYEGENGDKQGELLGHEGGIYGLSWHSSSRQFATASADRTVRVWDAAAQRMISTLAVGEKSDTDQQLGLIWANELIVSVSLAGNLVYVDPRANSIQRVIKGHSKSITAVSNRACDGTFFSGSYDGRLRILIVN
jgi:WD40 repeat protein